MEKGRAISRLSVIKGGMIEVFVGGCFCGDTKRYRFHSSHHTPLPPPRRFLTGLTPPKLDPRMNATESAIWRAAMT